MPSTSISTLTWPDPQASIVPLSANDILTRAKHQFYVAMYCLFMWCDAPETHAHLSASFMLFTLTAENAEPLVSSTDDEPMLSVTTDLFFSAFSFWQFIFRWPTFPQWKQLQFSLLSLVDFFDPLGLLDVVLIARDWNFVVDTCARNALDSAAVISVFNCFSIVHSFSSRMLVFHLLSSTNSQTLLTSWHSGPSVAKICPGSSSIGMLCNPHQCSSVYMSENNFSTLAT